MGTAPMYAILCRERDDRGCLSSKYRILHMGRGNRVKRYAKYRAYLKAGMPVRWVILTGNMAVKVSFSECGSSSWQQTQTRR